MAELYPIIPLDSERVFIAGLARGEWRLPLRTVPVVLRSRPSLSRDPARLDHGFSVFQDAWLRPLPGRDSGCSGLLICREPVFPAPGTRLPDSWLPDS